MNSKSKALRALADQYVVSLAEQPILCDYWSRLSLVLKGSAARGNADRYSDIDFVFFSDEEVRTAIIDAHRAGGLTDRSDGVFLPLGNWVGHYHFESLAHLAGYFTEPDYPQAWEYSHAVPLHDPGDQFRSLIAERSAELLSDPLPAQKALYLDLQLTLDWLRHPLKRGDSVSVLLHGARLLQGLCRMAYLLDARPYPHDKWLFHYLTETRFGRAHRAELLAYSAGLTAPVPCHLELAEYPQYAKAESLIWWVGAAIKRAHGEVPWIGEWWKYV